MSSPKKRRENEKAKQRYHTRKQKLLQERVQSTGQQIDGKKSRVPDKISKAFKDFLVGYKLKRDKLSVVKRNAVMWMIVKITGRYQATKQIGLRRWTLKSPGCVDAAYRRHQSKMGEQSAEALYEKNAVHLPGHRTVKKRLKKQKMVLTKPVGCLCDQLVLQHPDAKMSRQTVFRRRPARIMP